MFRSDPRTASRGIVDHPAAATAALAAAVSVCAASAIVLLGDFEKQSWRRTATSAAVAATGAPAAFALVDAILNHDDVVKFDQRIHTFMKRYCTPLGERMAKVTTMAGNRARLDAAGDGRPRRDAEAHRPPQTAARGKRPRR
jgi:prophage tail gpP-like protein